MTQENEWIVKILQCSEKSGNIFYEICELSMRCSNVGSSGSYAISILSISSQSICIAQPDKLQACVLHENGSIAYSSSLDKFVAVSLITDNSHGTIALYDCDKKRVAFMITTEQLQEQFGKSLRLKSVTRSRLETDEVADFLIGVHGSKGPAIGTLSVRKGGDLSFSTEVKIHTIQSINVGDKMKVVNAPGAALAYVICSTVHSIGNVYLCRTALHTTFAGVEYPLGFRRVGDSTMYIEREDEFDTTIVEAHENIIPKKSVAVPKRKTGRNEMSETGVMDLSESDELQFSASKNAMIDSSFFRSIKRPRIEENDLIPSLERDHKEDLIDIQHDSVGHAKSWIPSRPSDYAVSSVLDGPSSVVSIGPSETTKTLLKDGHLIANPTAIILTSLQRKDVMRKLDGLMQQGKRPELYNDFGAPPVGASYLCDAFQTRITYDNINEAADLSTVLRSGIEGSYGVRLKELRGNILDIRSRQSDISKRMACVLTDSAKSTEYFNTLTV